jgi:hypothetical protein
MLELLSCAPGSSRSCPYIVKQDPRVMVASAPPKIRMAMESARVTKGRTRDQVVVALAYPAG